MKSLPELLAIASGLTCEGPYRCCYCGAAASEPHELPDSFTTRDTLVSPRSGRICSGCQIAMQEVGMAVYHTGERYEFTKAFRRMCSWIISLAEVIAATKGHIPYLRSACLDPPETPFGISLAVSGQKHVLYRSVVCHSRDAVTVTLEGERVEYRIDQLRERLTLCGRIVAATGKPALAEAVTPSLWFRVCERYSGGEKICEEWCRVQNEPLSRLAAFLTSKKEDCERDYPGDRHEAVSAASSGPDRPEQKDGRGRRGQRQGRSEATLFGSV